MFTNSTIKDVFLKTTGHCHFCGDTLQLAKYAWKDLGNLDGAWEIDHVIQRGKGGSKNAENCLPACIRCNRLRWHRQGAELRELLLLGLVAKGEIKKSSLIGKELSVLKNRRLTNNIKRRRNIQSKAE